MKHDVLFRARVLRHFVRSPLSFRGASEARDPESIIPARGYGFRARRFASSRNDNGETGAGQSRFALAASVVAILLPAAARAQDYPSRPITLVVPYSAGGGNDLMARTAAEKMSKTLGQQIVIENRGGAGGSIATRQVAKSAPDGYTLGLGGTGTLAINPTLYGNVGYDPRKDFAPDRADRHQRAGRVRAPVAAGAHDPRADRARQERARASSPMPRPAPAAASISAASISPPSPASS